MIIVSKWYQYSNSTAGVDTGGRNVSNLWNHVPLLLAPEAVCHKRTCDKPAAKNEMVVIVVRKEGVAESHHDFRVR